MRRGIVDLASVIWTKLLGGKDKEGGREVEDADGKAHFVNSASWGYEGAIDDLIQTMGDLDLRPGNLILVKEGRNSKADRQGLHSLYKAGRDKLPEQYEEFQKCLDMVTSALLGVGANLCWQDGGVEADDVLGYLARFLKGERWIISGDKDLAQAVGGDVHHYRAGKYDENPFGDFRHSLIPVYIALVGDSVDKIPGAKGFGAAAFEKLLAAFGEDGLVAMQQLIRTKKLLELQEDVAELKELQKVIDDASGVYMSYELGRLRIERVNTIRRPLEWRAGMVRPLAQCEDERLRKWAGTVTVVHPGNYDKVVAQARKMLAKSPEVALDIETSTPPESDEWLELQDKEDKVVDVFGSELTSLQMTFGDNMQHTVYLPVDNVPDAYENLSVEQVRDFVDLIPRETQTVVHHAGFELPVCFNAWGKDWIDDPLYHGFLRNVIDSRIMSSYVDENRSAGLKDLSKNVLGYDQTSYDTVTLWEGPKEEWNGRGKVLTEFKEQIPVVVGREEDSEVVDDETGEIMLVPGTEIVEYQDGQDMIRVRFKMNDLRVEDVLGYGADDTICTSAVSAYFRLIMELENTWGVFMEVEQFPAYLTAKAFIDGVDFSGQTMREMMEEDDKKYDQSWATLRDYLIKIGFEGTRYVPIEEWTPAEIKRAYLMLTGQELKTLVRTPSKLAKLVEEEAPLLSTCINSNDLGSLNEFLAGCFDGEPKLDLASPKQMCTLLYDILRLPVNIINDCTATEKEKQPKLAEAVARFKKKRNGSEIELSDEELLLVRKKAKADDTAIQFALAFNADLIDDEARAALIALGDMKEVMTRRSLFYKNYKHIRHWKDGKIHASLNQCAAVTRRYSASNPNLQQLPKKGEGVKFRGCFKPHHKRAVICSIDFNGQELRLAAERSQDANLLSCYVGDNLKDVHSITAAGSMKLKWGAEAVKELFEQYGGETEYEVFCTLRAQPKSNPIKKKADDLRKDSKNVNFTAQFGGGALKISERLIMPLTDAQLFLEARSKMFPDVDKAAQRAEEQCAKLGYALTLMGARRHLREGILSDDSWAASRAARQAWNFEIQGSAAEMTKLGMARLWKSEFLWKFDTRFIGPIHDELVTSIAAEHAIEAIRIKHACMTAPYSTMRVPILGSISLGPDFAQQYECDDLKGTFEEKIRQCLDSSFKEAAVA